MVFGVVALVCTGIFAGAALYITFVEHPARLECGTAVAVAEFGPSYRRAAVMQATLAGVGFGAGVEAWSRGAGTTMLVSALLLGSVIPLTLIVILPTNKRLKDPSLDPSSQEAAALLARWGRLHALRSVASGAAFVLMALNLIGGL